MAVGLPPDLGDNDCGRPSHAVLFSKEKIGFKEKDMEKMKKKLPMKPKHIAILVVFVFFLIFLIQNTQVVTLRLYFWTISMSQIILIPLCILIGALLGYFGPALLKKGKGLKK